MSIFVFPTLTKSIFSSKTSTYDRGSVKKLNGNMLSNVGSSARPQMNSYSDFLLWFHVSYLHLNLILIMVLVKGQIAKYPTVQTYVEIHFDLCLKKLGHLPWVTVFRVEFNLACVTGVELIAVRQPAANTTVLWPVLV